MKSGLHDGFDLPLAGFSVNQCIVDFAFSLHLVRPPESVADQENALLRVAGPFECELSGTVVRCDPEHDPEGLGVALKLFRKTVASAVVDEGGTSR